MTKQEDDLRALLAEWLKANGDLAQANKECERAALAEEKARETLGLAMRMGRDHIPTHLCMDNRMFAIARYQDGHFAVSEEEIIKL